MLYEYNKNKLREDYYKELELVQHEALPACNSSDLTGIGLFVCLSGRTTFQGEFVTADIAKFKEMSREVIAENIDLEDTINRMAGTIYLAKQSYRLTGKLPAVYFNGTKEHNDSLKSWLSKCRYFLELPTECFVVDDIPLDNTIGQAIGLNSYINSLANNCPDVKINKIVLVSSSYHVPRVSRIFGSNSPLLTTSFYKSNPNILRRLSSVQKGEILEGKFPLRDACICVHGIDKVATSRPAAMHDIRGEVLALGNYALAQKTPSLPKDISSNVVTFSSAITRMSFENAKWFEDFIAKQRNKYVGLSLRCNG